jgi:hypothetical protein
MKDFTPNTYSELLRALQTQDFTFQTFKDFILSPAPKVVVLRHDVDAKPANALRFARLQHKMGIAGTYYFRIVKKSYNKPIIREIASLGHEIGYHYETMASNRGNIEKAYEEFCYNLERFQRHAPIHTISMHGSPLSLYDNRKLWERYDYKALGIIAEPYFDVDYTKVLYLTDTGRRWDGAGVNIRDKALVKQPLKIENTKIRSTDDLIRYINAGKLPPHVLINTHPQRWNDATLPWLKELVLQNAKNQVKRLLVLIRK